jgi:hypothetical protein
MQGYRPTGKSKTDLVPETLVTPGTCSFHKIIIRSMQGTFYIEL